MKAVKPMATDIALSVLSAVLFVGVLTFFQPCGPMEDGAWMNCHWAGQALAALGGVLLALNVLRWFVGTGTRNGLDLAAIAVSLAAAVIPGHLIPLCMMPQMRCRTVMTPWVTVCAVLLILAAGADLVLRRRKRNHEV